MGYVSNSQIPRYIVSWGKGYSFPVVRSAYCPAGSAFPSYFQNSRYSAKYLTKHMYSKEDSQRYTLSSNYSLKNNSYFG